MLGDLYQPSYRTNFHREWKNCVRTKDEFAEDS